MTEPWSSTEPPNSRVMIRGSSALVWKTTGAPARPQLNTRSSAISDWTHGADRAERNMLRAVDGGADTLDAATLATLQQVLS